MHIAKLNFRLLILFKLLSIYFSIVKSQDSNSCDSRIHAYKNGKTMEECRQEARKTTELLSEEISNAGEVSWRRVLDLTDYDELVYKLTLKYLRQKGYDIGNNTIPRIKNI